jgi:hypothetical protein
MPRAVTKSLKLSAHVRGPEHVVKQDVSVFWVFLGKHTFDVVVVAKRCVCDNPLQNCRARVEFIKCLRRIASESLARGIWSREWGLPRPTHPKPGCRPYDPESCDRVSVRKPTSEILFTYETCSSNSRRKMPTAGGAYVCCQTRLTRSIYRVVKLIIKTKTTPRV